MERAQFSHSRAYVPAKSLLTVTLISPLVLEKRDTMIRSCRKVIHATALVTHDVTEIIPFVMMPSWTLPAPDVALSVPMERTVVLPKLTSVDVTLLRATPDP